MIILQFVGDVILVNINIDLLLIILININIDLLLIILININIVFFTSIFN